MYGPSSVMTVTFQANVIVASTLLTKLNVLWVATMRHTMRRVHVLIWLGRKILIADQIAPLVKPTVSVQMAAAEMECVESIATMSSKTRFTTTQKRIWEKTMCSSAKEASCLFCLVGTLLYGSAFWCAWPSHLVLPASVSTRSVKKKMRSTCAYRKLCIKPKLISMRSSSSQTLLNCSNSKWCPNMEVKLFKG